MLYVVGIGCGNRNGLTIEAENVIAESDLIVGYTVYAELLKKIFPNKTYFTTSMRQEIDRVRYALEKSTKMTVSLVCSGDSEVYGMAALAYQLADEYKNIKLKTIAGVTSALSGGALLGAPLTNDFAVISLSDLLTPMDKILTRVELAARADMTIVLYNPASKGRPEHLKIICGKLLEILSPNTPCGYAKNVGRSGEESGVMSLSELQNFPADMFTTVFIGSSQTKIIGGKLVTERGYKDV